MPSQQQIAHEYDTSEGFPNRWHIVAYFDLCTLRRSIAQRQNIPDYIQLNLFLHFDSFNCVRLHTSMPQIKDRIKCNCQQEHSLEWVSFQGTRFHEACCPEEQQHAQLQISHTTLIQHHKSCLQEPEDDTHNCLHFDIYAHKHGDQSYKRDRSK